VEYVAAVLRGSGDVFLIFVSYGVCLSWSSSSTSSSRVLWKYLGLLTASILIVMAYRGWDVYDKIEIFVKICFPGLFGVYEGLRRKDERAGIL